MGFYPTYTAIFNAYTRSKLANIRGLQGPIYPRAKMRVYAITDMLIARYAGMKSALLRKGCYVYDANEKYLLKEM